MADSERQLSLRERALEAYQEVTALLEIERREREERDRDHEAAELKSEIKRLFGLDAEPVGDSAADVRVEIEGITFRLIRRPFNEYIRDLHAELPCQDCGEAVRYRIVTLASLGEFLSGRRGKHVCRRPEQENETTSPPSPPPPTVDERLLSVLREWVTEVASEVRSDG